MSASVMVFAKVAVMPTLRSSMSWPFRTFMGFLGLFSSDLPHRLRAAKRA
jgi:hypothetical protein